jgi:hypothetical protein
MAELRSRGGLQSQVQADQPDEEGHVRHPWNRHQLSRLPQSGRCHWCVLRHCLQNSNATPACARRRPSPSALSSRSHRLLTTDRTRCAAMNRSTPSRAEPSAFGRSVACRAGVCGEYTYVEQGPKLRKPVEVDAAAKDPFKPPMPPKSVTALSIPSARRRRQRARTHPRSIGHQAGRSSIRRTRTRRRTDQLSGHSLVFGRIRRIRCRNALR